MKCLERLWDLIFPKKCIHCGRNGSYLCEDCLFLIEINPFEYCLCDKIEKRSRCENCKDKKLDKILSTTNYNQKIIQQAIHKFKYSYIKELSLQFSFLMLRHLELTNNIPDKDFLIIPVPLSPSKKRRRGFNQSEEMARIISTAMGIEMDDYSLKKMKNNLPQAGLGKEERTDNIKGCYQVGEKNSIKDKKIILIDDVYTTGATMEECAKALKESGAKEVWGLTIAREL